MLVRSRTMVVITAVALLLITLLGIGVYKVMQEVNNLDTLKQMVDVLESGNVVSMITDATQKAVLVANESGEAYLENTDDTESLNATIFMNNGDAINISDDISRSVYEHQIATINKLLDCAMTAKKQTTQGVNSEGAPVEYDIFVVTIRDIAKIKEIFENSVYSTIAESCTEDTTIALDIFNGIIKKNESGQSYIDKYDNDKYITAELLITDKDKGSVQKIFSLHVCGENAGVLSLGNDIYKVDMENGDIHNIYLTVYNTVESIRKSINNIEE